MIETTLTAHDGLELAVAIFEAEETKALVQIIHGAKEHKKRYYNFCEFLRGNGLTVVISDNRGHGESINGSYPLGYMDGYEEIIDDQIMISKHVKGLFPDKDLYLFGHSLGSIFARIYLQEHDDEIKKLVLSGTPYYVPIVKLGIMIGQLITLLSGKQSYNKLLNTLAVNNKDDSWISASQSNLERYRNDPLCQYDYRNEANVTVFRADYELHQFKKFKCKNGDLHILNITGAGDPITGGEKGLQDSIESLKKVGYDDITNIVYPNMKHEILNEDNNEVVYHDILEFLLND